ncbi:MAG: hypothetical protein AAGC73_06675 [Verrucomicrobiota bacterium]
MLTCKKLISNKFITLTIAVSGALLSGCDNSEPATYYIPKEERAVNTPAMPAAAPAEPKSSASPPASTAPSPMQMLPGMKEAAAKAGEFTYTCPPSWIEQPAGGVRKASFRIESDSGSADVSVTAFPGDVGGLTANINRWCGQVGMSPLSDQQVAEVAKPYTISKHAGRLVLLQGPSESILGGILPFHGYTWFFKMKGDNVTVVQETEAMQQFLDSVALKDDHH